MGAWAVATDVGRCVTIVLVVAILMPANAHGGCMETVWEAPMPMPANETLLSGAKTPAKKAP